MKKRLIYIIALLPMVMALQPIATRAGVQADTSGISYAFNRYADNHLVEKIFVHTDRTFYLSGETIWFEVYSFNGVNNKLLDLSKVAYVDLIDDQKRNVMQVMVELKGGTGKGSVTIPLSQPSGNFVLRAYTKWMQNFNDVFFFRKTVTIVNPFISMGPAGPAAETYDIQFLPEGGNLVEDIESTVAFRATDSKGKGMDFMGSLLNNDGETITTFSPQSLGMGKLTFTPLKGATYHALVTFNNGDKRDVSLPAAQPSGLVIHLDEQGQQLRLIVNSRGNSGSTTITLFVHNHGKAVYEQQQDVSAGHTVFVVDKSILGAGISRFTVFDQKRRPICERLYFKRPKDELAIHISDHDKYGERSAVQLGIQTSNTAGDAEKAQLSVSVFRTDSLQPEQADYLQSYLWLFSDLHGTVESPLHYLRDAGDNALDLLMLTHGWSRFRWTDVLSSDNSPVISPEHRYPTVRVKVTDPSGIAMPNIPTYLSVSGKYFRIQHAISDVNGIVTFEVPDVRGPHQIVVRADAPNDSLVTFTLESAYADANSESVPSSLALLPNVADNLLSRSVWMQATNSYWDNYINKFLAPEYDSALFYGNPDETYILDDYTRFPVMEEVLREYVTGIFVRRQKGQFVLHTLDLNHKEMFNSPLVLIDGVPVFNPDKIMAFDPLKIQRLDVKERECVEGEITAHGVISFFTYNGDLAGFPLDEDDIVTNYSGLPFEREFYSPKYSLQVEGDRVPDYRTTLFWSPETFTDIAGKADLEFFTGDVPGNYTIVVQGVSDSGLSGTAVGRFRVMEKNK